MSSHQHFPRRHANPPPIVPGGGVVDGARSGTEDLVSVTSTLRQWLASRTQHQLVEILNRRPDVLGPFRPRDLGDVADRLHYPHSLRSVLYDLPQPCVEVLSALLVFENDGMTRADLAATMHLPPDDVHLDAAIHVCTEWAVVWEIDGRLHVPGSLRSLMPSPLRLGPPVAELLSPRTVDDLRARAEALGLPMKSRKVEILAALEAFYADGAAVRRLWNAAPDEQRELLTVAAWSHPVLQYQTPYAHPGRPDPAIAYLLVNGLVLGDWQSLIMPREVGLAIRGDDWHPTLSAKPEVTAPGTTGIATAGAPSGVTLLAAVPVPQETADQDAAAASNSAIEHVAALVEACGITPAALLKSGGVGVRELRRLAKAAALPEGAGAEGGEVRLWIELAHAAHLLGAEKGTLMPTPAFDEWRALPPADRLIALLDTWLELPTIPLMEGQPTRPALITIGFGSTYRPAGFGPGGFRRGGYRPVTPESASFRPAGFGPSGATIYGSPAYGSVGSHLRTDVLLAATEWPAGTAFATISDLHAIVRWRRPMVAATLADAANAVDPTWAEARMLGIVGRDTLSSLGRALIADGQRGPDSGADGSDNAADGSDSASAGHETATSGLAHVAAAFVHPPSAEAIFQADLTVVVPGSPSSFVSSLLDTVGTRESRGSATTWRISPASVRRALDAGGAPDDVLRELRGIAVGGKLPQPLEYLVGDVARRHGALRVRTVACVLRADDPALLAEIAAAKSLASLGLVVLAPNVLASAVPMEKTLAQLRAAGYAPVGEDESGTTVLERPTSRRTADCRVPAEIGTGHGGHDHRDHDHRGHDHSGHNQGGNVDDDGYEYDDEYDDDGEWTGTRVPGQTRNPASSAQTVDVATVVADILRGEIDRANETAARLELTRNLGVPAVEPSPPPPPAIEYGEPTVDMTGVATPPPVPSHLATLRTVHAHAPQLSPAEQRLLAAAIDAERPVWIQYSSLDGQQTRRIIEPTDLDGNIITAWCRLRDDERNFALNRIRGVTAV